MSLMARNKALRVAQGTMSITLFYSTELTGKTFEFTRFVNFL